MRYPEDLFKVQREVLASYHVTNAKTFYEGSDRWKVPEDPENKTQSQPPYRLSVRTPTGGDEPVFSLTSVYVPLKRQNLASFISVDADAALNDYGKIRILRLPSNTQVPGPSQIANQFASDQQIQDRLLAFTRTNSKALFGNLLTLPAGDGLLYVQPLYTLRQAGEGRYPVLRYVLVSFGEDVGIGSTLTAALDDVLGITTPEESVEPGTAPPPRRRHRRHRATGVRQRAVAAAPGRREVRRGREGAEGRATWPATRRRPTRRRTWCSRPSTPRPPRTRPTRTRAATPRRRPLIGPLITRGCRRSVTSPGLRSGGSDSGPRGVARATPPRFGVPVTGPVK